MDHKADADKPRIRARGAFCKTKKLLLNSHAGGFVTPNGRLNGELAVSRSLGDLSLRVLLFLAIIHGTALCQLRARC